MRYLILAAAAAAVAAISTGCGTGAGSNATTHPTLHVLSSITDGAALADPVEWTAQPVGLARGDAVDRVEFIIDGRVRWTEHKAPYFFNDDNNHLYPWVLGTGQHRLAVQLTTTRRKTVGVSAQVSVPAQQQPAVLAGTYTRSVTTTDIQRTDSLRNEPASQVLPAGVWRLHVGRDGVFLFDDPQGAGGSEAFIALPNGTLAMQGPVNWLEPASRQGGFCSIERAGSYQWAASGRTLTLTARSDRCADRNSMFTGTWRRT